MKKEKYNLTFHDDQRYEFAYALYICKKDSYF